MSSLALTLCALSFFVTQTCALAAIPRYSTNPDDFVRSRLQHFWVNGQPTRFVGYNVRGLAHYGAGYFFGDSQASDRETNLAYMESVGAKVARIFVAYRFATTQAISDGLDAALQVASQHNIRLIVALTDEYYNPNFYPPGDYIYYTDGLLNQSFFSSGYQVNYLPLVQTLVTRFKDDPTVFAWQVGNELKCPWNPGQILPFSHSVAVSIRAIDENHMVSFGTAGRAFSGLSTSQATVLYADYDFLTIHVYNGDEGLDDSGLANQLRKPLLVSEAGFDTDNPDRPAATNADIAKWVGRGARGYMNWGLMVADNGDGDDIFGIDPFNHAYDWADYTAVYQQWAAALSTTPMPAPDPPTGIAASRGTWGDRVRIAWNESFAATEYAVFRAGSITGGKTQISPWQSARTFDDTTATRGTSYWYWLKARNSGGQSGYSPYDQGYTSSAPEMSIAQAKSQPNGVTAFVTGGIVSAVFGDRFHVQQSGRYAGIGVTWSGTVNVGDHANILGTISAPTTGERLLTPTSVSILP